MKSYYVIIVCIIVVFIYAFQANERSNAAPASSTGAPGEVSCATSSCHDDHIINNGIGQLEINMNSIASSSLSVKISMQRDTTTRFGFQIVALDKEGNSSGQFTITDNIKTQVIQNYVGSPIRDYVTYTYAGTSPSSTDKGEWEFEWTPDAHGPEMVYFYYAAVAANDDGTDKGDEVYLGMDSLYTSFLSVGHEYTYAPRIIQDNSRIEIRGFDNSEYELSIFNLNGQVILNEIFPLNRQHYLDLPAIENGIYCIRLTNLNSEKVHSQKMWLQ